MRSWFKRSHTHIVFKQTLYMRSWFKRLPYTYCLSIDFIYEVMVSKRSHTHIVSQQTLWLGQGLNAPIHILSLNRLYDWVKTLLEFSCCLQGYRKIHRSQKRSHTHIVSQQTLQLGHGFKRLPYTYCLSTDFMVGSLGIGIGINYFCSVRSSLMLYCARVPIQVVTAYVIMHLNFLLQASLVHNSL